MVLDNSSEYHVNIRVILLTLAQNKSRTTQDHNLKKLHVHWTLLPNVTYHVLLQSTNQPSISAEDIKIYGYGSPFGHVTKIIQKNLFPDPKRLHMKSSLQVG